MLNPKTWLFGFVQMMFLCQLGGFLFTSCYSNFQGLFVKCFGELDWKVGLDIQSQGSPTTQRLDLGSVRSPKPDSMKA